MEVRSKQLPRHQKQQKKDWGERVENNTREEHYGKTQSSLLAVATGRVQPPFPVD